MPSVYDLKPAFQSLLRPIVGALVGAGITPNHLTLAAVVGSIGVGMALLGAYANPRLVLLLPVWLFLRMALNAMDGMAAREHGKISRLGGALNEVGDVVSDAALYLPLGTLGPAHLWPAVMFTLVAVLSEFCGVLGVVLGGTRRYDGPMGKSDRAFVIGALGLVSGIVPSTLEWWPVVLWLGAGLGVLTCWNRVARTLRTVPG